jgi:hypothetical protein
MLITALPTVKINTKKVTTIKCFEKENLEIARRSSD